MKLTPNFSLAEFACKDGTEVPAHLIPNAKHLAEQLEVIRKECGNKRININSAYRTKDHNAKIGGKPNSYHLEAMAADITIPGMTPAEIALRIRNLMFDGTIEKGGLKAYGTFVHYDTRGNYVTW